MAASWAQVSMCCEARGRYSSCRPHSAARRHATVDTSTADSLGAIGSRSPPSNSFEKLQKKPDIEIEEGVGGGPRCMVFRRHLRKAASNINPQSKWRFRSIYRLFHAISCYFMLFHSAESTPTRTKAKAKTSGANSAKRRVMPSPVKSSTSSASNVV